MKLLDRIMEEIGYMPIHLHKNKQLYQRRDYEDKLRKMESKKIDELVEAIRTVNMVKVRSDSPYRGQTAWLEYEPDEVVRQEYDYPPDSRWYKYQVLIDVSKLQRIYADMGMSQNSYEFEYLKQSLWRDIEYNLDALMKLELGMK